MSDGSMSMGKPWWSAAKVLWMETHVTLTFHLDDPQVKDLPGALGIEDLNQYLFVRGFRLKPYIPDIAPGGEQEEHDQPEIPLTSWLTNTSCHCLFEAPDGHGMTVVGFFTVEDIEMSYPMQDMLAAGYDRSYSRQVVNLINRNLLHIQQNLGIPLVAAAPNWMGAAAPNIWGCIIHGGPALPPLPLPANDSDASASGSWPLSLPDLEGTPLAAKSGKGVTVFVLDTMPLLPDNPDAVTNFITEAANRAGGNNMLLQTVSEQMNREQSPFVKFRYQPLSTILQEGAHDQMITGRDLDGKMYGFGMPDHGLFVTGIIRELAPDADIEYVRVLNDFGGGDCYTLINTLEWIHGRMSRIDPRTGQPGDLYDKPVVINLSLVMTPSDENLYAYWHTSNGGYSQSDALSMAYDLATLRAPLHRAIQRVEACGAVIVGAAGNDSHTPDMPGRIGPRYPAAFPEVLAVGAVDREAEAACYSNYPKLPAQRYGIATYGGGMPTRKDIARDDVDALIGLYSSTSYPATEGKNPPTPDYPAPNNNAWAYWSGTSFATPIVSAVAARLLEQGQANNLPARHRAAEVMWALTTPEGQKETLGSVLKVQPELGVSLLRAEQRHTGQAPLTSATPGVAVPSIG
ncbi:S8 family peptidase [Ktedonospora formicarum]|uniref:Peptidase S8/S53 domain-containing protein n=1 Tax=Ktedonospora formicarum TaxID=2778364 RepID=A0A8J3MSM5_9CHLR|nr:S8 family serine peptidase [Ktedonospora formicarum]GHO44773.1 hypothetical protein KSX_29360 [Ktedonospora formicarum]